MSRDQDTAEESAREALTEARHAKAPDDQVIFVQDLSKAIIAAIRKFVQHDTEWCAVAADELAQRYRGEDEKSHVLTMSVAQQLENLAASYRMRGREP